MHNWRQTTHVKTVMLQKRSRQLLSRFKWVYSCYIEYNQCISVQYGTLLPMYVHSCSIWNFVTHACALLLGKGVLYIGYKANMVYPLNCVVIQHASPPILHVNFKEIHVRPDHLSRCHGHLIRSIYKILPRPFLGSRTSCEFFETMVVWSLLRALGLKTNPTRHAPHIILLEYATHLFKATLNGSKITSCQFTCQKRKRGNKKKKLSPSICLF